MEKIFFEVLELAKKKYNYHLQKSESDDKHILRTSHIPYLKWIFDEIQEVNNEIKKNNAVYLEDELWDVFYDYINLLYLLEKDWYIFSIESVLDRIRKKFSERVWNPEQRHIIKQKQKKEMQEEHFLHYWDES